MKIYCLNLYTNLLLQLQSYDRLQKNRKCLLLHTNKTDLQGDDYMMVEPPPFDIYLCDNCDAELYSKEAILVSEGYIRLAQYCSSFNVFLFAQEHEKMCIMEDDVILCDSPEPENKIEIKSENTELRNAFLLNFCLQSKATNCNYSKKIQGTNTNNEELVTMTSNRKRRISSRRNRAVPSLNRCSFIPISSPAGQKLLSSIKQTISMEYVFERQERLDRFCYTPLIKPNCNHKIFEKKNCTNNIHITFKKLQYFSSHIYTFPRRQFLQRRYITQNFLFLNSPLIKKCRPISVRLKKMTDNSGEQFPINNTKLNIRLTRDTSLNSQWRISPSSEVIVDTIDLCSSDDDDQSISSTKIPKADKFAVMSLAHNNEIAVIQKNHSSESERNSLPEYLQTTDDNSLKPLKQSVYIYSNYKTNSELNTFSLEPKANSSAKPLVPSNTLSHSHNQENCNLSKRLVTAASEWRTSSEKGEINQSETIAFENIAGLNTFTTSARIVSIDLTT